MAITNYCLDGNLHTLSVKKALAFLSETFPAIDIDGRKPSLKKIITEVVTALLDLDSRGSARWVVGESE